MLAAPARGRLQSAPTRDSAILNGCRALRFAEDGRWYSKVEAGRRAAAAGGRFGPVVDAALAAYDLGRQGGTRLPVGMVREFLAYVATMLQRRASVASRSRTD